MKSSFIFLLFLLLILFAETKTNKKSSSKLKEVHTFNYTYNNTLNESILFEGIKYLKNDDNFIFRNFPRRNKEDFNMSTFSKYDKEKKEFIKWPSNNDYNDRPLNSNDCSHFISIIDFEFDEDNNIYLLDEGNEFCSINLYVFNLEGGFLQNFTVTKKNKIFLTNFVLDRINNYAYIPFYNLNENSDNSDYRAGIFVKELIPKVKGGNKEIFYESKIVYLKEQILIYDEKYNFENKFIKDYFEIDEKQIINVALSCDGLYLILCPLSSRMIYSVLTSTLRDESISFISINDVNEGYKNDASSSLITSNMDNLYLTGLEKNVIYFANQIENDLSEFDFKHFDKEENEDMGWPTKLSITDGVLYILSKKIEIDSENNYVIYNQIFRASIGDDKSYVYKCAGLAYRWHLIAYFIWGFFAVIVIFVLVFVYVGNEMDKEIMLNKKKK